jgi:hypothetical protein
MDQSKYNQFVIDYIQEAIEESDGSVSGIANYLEKQKKPGFLASGAKKEAFYRVKKVFTEMRDRPFWLVLKALGLREEDIEQES